MSERGDGLEFDRAAKPEMKTHLAVNLLLLLALAVPLSCVAFLSLLEILGVMTLGGVIRMVGTLRTRCRNLGGEASAGAH